MGRKVGSWVRVTPCAETPGIAARTTRAAGPPARQQRGGYAVKRTSQLATPCLWTLLVILLPALVQAQQGGPCSGQSNNNAPTEIEDVDLEMPVPDTGGDWTHVQGSTAHVRRDQNALDLNENATSFNFDDGLPVLAAAEGEVVFAAQSNGNCGGYGYNVMVEHVQDDETFLTHYAHMSENLMVERGDKVRQGQVLGYISNTSSTAGLAVHLHFSVRQGASAKYADLNGQDTSNANTNDLTLTSDTRMVWLESFEESNPAWPTQDGFEIDQGRAVLSAPDPAMEVMYERYVHVREQNGPYRVSFAVQGEQATPGSIELQVRMACYDEDKDMTGTAFLPTEFDTHQGWAIRSLTLGFGNGNTQCPTGTRFVRPILRAEGDNDKQALVDWLMIEENPDAGGGGNLRYNVFTWGSERIHRWVVPQPSDFSRLRVLGGRQRDRLDRAVEICQFVPTTVTGQCDRSLDDVNMRYYWFELTATDGKVRTLGPVGPSEPFVRVDVPGLGVSNLRAMEVEDMPLTVDYPYALFDGNRDTFGIVNESAAPISFSLIPMTPASDLTAIRGHFGGDSVDWEVTAIDGNTDRVVEIGTASNTTPSRFSTIEGNWPTLVSLIGVLVDHVDGDRFARVAEIQFSGEGFSNLGFELGDLTGWDAEGTVTVIESLGTETPPEGQFMAMVSTGGEGIARSTLRTFDLEVPAGTSEIVLDYNFLTDELDQGAPFNDFFRATLELSDGTSQTIIEVSRDDLLGNALPSPVPEFDGMTGFKEARADVSGVGGTVSLQIEILVQDVGDTIVDSAVLIDNLRFE